ncbi:uncharacterized protein LOC129593164 [Paramacrobiotus metropolitanus]|uniref:uncharacterized protein LOC129593164 n=1 Tax=Paramacrobiotus metropolitanus TaxID=2943436 RepID=UPI002445A1CF|nr:uncharacterized protein LOC129593164 [Paramacrobiotus metropolitanus]
MPTNHMTRRYCYSGITRRLAGLLLVFLVSLLILHLNNRLHHTTLYPHHPVTVVTAYFRIPSKHTPQEYFRWMENFLRHVDCHLYIFTEPALLPNLTSLRQPYLSRTRFITLPFNDLSTAPLLPQLEALTRKYPEKNVTAQLMAIWHAKWRFIISAINENVFTSEYFIWCDIGSFRQPRHLPQLKHFPDAERTKSVLRDRHQVYLLLTEPFPASVTFRRDSQLAEDTALRAAVSQLHIGGTLAAGHRDAWRMWERAYYPLLEQLLAAGIHAGQDQVVMNAIALKYPQLVHLIKPKAYFGGTGNPWFYFQYYFSAAI